jgi:hypothetical protein
MQQCCAQKWIATIHANCKGNVRNRSRSVETRGIFGTVGSELATGEFGVNRTGALTCASDSVGTDGLRLKNGFIMLVTALLAPRDHRRKILLLAIFAFIALC